MTPGFSDHSHYDGYVCDPGKPPLKDASLILNGDRLFLNEHDLRCHLDDLSLQSLRIQLHSQQYRDGDKVRVAIPVASLYFDFWDKEKGFSKKCVTLYIRLGWRKLSRVESELGRQNDKEARKHIQELEAQQISPTRAAPSDPGQLGLF